MDRDGVEVHKHAKKEPGQYPAILTEQACMMNKTFILWLSGKFFLHLINPPHIPTHPTSHLSPTYTTQPTAN